jgi:hypothetical protein
MTCGIDLIRVTLKESFSGFDYFLRKYGSRIASSHDLGGYNQTISFNFLGIGYEATVSFPHKTISIIAGGLREYRHDSRSKRRWLFLKTLYSDYPQLKITELHFAIDIPYWFDELKVEPKRYTNKHEESSLYFDRRRTGTVPVQKLNTRDDIIIYDKSWKCGLSLPMTRIELRLRPEQISTITSNGCIVENESLQEHLAAIITKKLRTLKIKKGRSTIRLEKCDKHIAISIAMQYLQGDDSLLSKFAFINYFLQLVKYKLCT